MLVAASIAPHSVIPLQSVIPTKEGPRCNGPARPDMDLASSVTFLLGRQIVVTSQTTASGASWRNRYMPDSVTGIARVCQKIIEGRCWKTPMWAP